MILIFWAFFFSLILSFEFLLLYPANYFYWAILCLASSTGISWFLTKEEKKTKTSVAYQIIFILFCFGIFWWILWLDFKIIKFFIPVFAWVFIFSLIKDSVKSGIMNKKTKLACFLGASFFWSTICYGLITVLGWKLWAVFFIFVFLFLIISWPASLSLDCSFGNSVKAWLLLVFLGSELFATIAWLPLAESTLGAVFTLMILIVYDLEKYYVNPESVRRRIIVRKVLLYILFLTAILASSSWS